MRHKLEMANGGQVGAMFNPAALRPAYTESIPLQLSKVKDLEKLLPFLEPAHSNFYEYIILENLGAF